jgi:ABC-type dipeptide/oligopeptide/nickel transport system permease component
VLRGERLRGPIAASLEPGRGTPVIRHALHRLVQTLVVLGIVSFLIFVMLVVAGDPLELMLPPAAGLAEREELKQRLGLDQPWYIQYGRFLRGAVRGDFGRSYYFGQPALPLVLERLPASLSLVGAALGIAVAPAIPLGILLARRRGSAADHLGLAGTLVCMSAPTFWIGLVLIFVFAVELGWLPTSGSGSWRHLVLPAVTLALYRVALFTRLVRASMVEVLGEDYVRTARAKGQRERAVVWRHALRNTLLPFLTVGGIQGGALIAYSIVTEKIFAWPGMGLLLLTSLERLDYPVVVAYAVVTAGIFIVLNFAVDMLYALVDPRVTRA